MGTSVGNIEDVFGKIIDYTFGDYDDVSEFAVVSGDFTKTSHGTDVYLISEAVAAIRTYGPGSFLVRSLGDIEDHCHFTNIESKSDDDLANEIAIFLTS